MTESKKEAPIVSFRVPLDVVDRLIEEGRLKSNYSKSELSNLIRNDWLANLGAEVPITVDANVVNNVDSKLDKVLRLLETRELGKQAA